MFVCMYRVLTWKNSGMLRVKSTSWTKTGRMTKKPIISSMSNMCILCYVEQTTLLEKCPGKTLCYGIQSDMKSVGLPGEYCISLELTVNPGSHGELLLRWCCMFVSYVQNYTVDCRIGPTIFEPSSNWLGRVSPNWPVVCRVGIKPC